MDRYLQKSTLPLNFEKFLLNTMQINLKVALLVATFMVFYFYLKFMDVTGIILYLSIGVFTGIIAYSIFSKQTKLTYRIGISIVTLIIVLLFPWLLNTEEEPQALAKDARNKNNKLQGDWVSDTIGGYAIRLQIESDSVSLSQSNMAVSKKFEWRVNDDFLEFENEQTDQFLSWRFELKEKDDILMLKKQQDTLILRRY